MATKEPVPGVPSLHSIPHPILTSKEHILNHITSFFFANPGGTSSVTEGEMLSFRKLVAKYGSVNPDDLAVHISDILTQTIQHYFPNDGITATCSIEEEEGYSEGVYQGNYAIVIAYRDADGAALTNSKSIKTSKDGSKFEFLVS